MCNSATHDTAVTGLLGYCASVAAVQLEGVYQTVCRELGCLAVSVIGFCMTKVSQVDKLGIQYLNLEMKYE